MLSKKLCGLGAVLALVSIGAAAATSNPADYGLSNEYSLLAGGVDGASFVTFAASAERDGDLARLPAFMAKDEGKKEGFVIEINCKTAQYQVFNSMMLAKFETERDYQKLGFDPSGKDAATQFFTRACGVAPTL